MTWAASRYSTSPRQFGQARMLSSSALNGMGSSPRGLRPRSGGTGLDSGSGRLVADPRHLLLGAGLDVQAQQRLGVAGAQVEPPVGGVDGEPVGPVTQVRRVAL